MPIIKSAIKKLKQDKLRTTLNESFKHAYKDVVRDVRVKAHKKSAITKDDITAAYSKIDKAAKKRVIKKGKANRLKSRISKLAQKGK